MTDVMGIGLAPLDREVAPRLDAALVESARLRRRQREEIMETAPTLTYEMLADARGVKTSSVRTWVSRQRRAGRLVTIDHHGTKLVPSFQLDSACDVRDDVADLVVRQVESGMSAWAVWTWWVTPNAWLEEPPTVAMDAGAQGDVVVAMDRLLETER